jgi:hypothetical protein
MSVYFTVCEGHQSPIILDTIVEFIDINKCAKISYRMVGQRPEIVLFRTRSMSSLKLCLHRIEKFCLAYTTAEITVGVSNTNNVSNNQSVFDPL